MKKLLSLISVCILFAFAAEKKYTLTEGQAVMTFNALEAAKKVIPTAENLSAKEASYHLQAIDSIQKVIHRQYKDTAK